MPAPTAANPNPAFGFPVRIPIENDNTNANTVDHFIPGISADQNTSGATAHLGLYFYSFRGREPAPTRIRQTRRTSATYGSGSCRRRTAAHWSDSDVRRPYER